MDSARIFGKGLCEVLLACFTYFVSVHWFSFIAECLWRDGHNYLPRRSLYCPSEWKMSEKTPQSKRPSIVTPVQALYFIPFFKVCIGQEHIWMTFLLRCFVSEPESEELPWALRYWVCILQKTLIATVFAKTKQKTKKPYSSGPPKGVSCSPVLFVCVSSVHPLLPLTDACILVSSSLAFSFRLPFREALPPSLWLRLFLTPSPPAA